MDRRHQLILNLAISIALFFVIFYLVGLDKIIAVLLQADPLLLALALIVYVIVNVLMSLRIRIVLSAMEEKLGLADIFPSNLAGMLASDFTPARVGYFFTAFSISSRHSISTKKTISAIFGPQLFDFLIKVASASILTVLIISRFGIEGVLLNILVIAAALGAIIFAGLLVFYPPFLSSLSIFERIPFASKVFSFLRGMHEHTSKILSIKWKVILITFISWLAKGTEWLVLSHAIGISITGDLVQDLLFIMVFQGAITIIQFVPVPTLAGAGASEAGFAAILSLFGIPFEQSVTFGILTRFVMVIVDAFSLPVILDYLHKHSLEGTMERLSRLH